MKFSTIISFLALAAPAFTAPTSDAASSGEVYPMHITLNPPSGESVDLVGTYEDLIPQIKEVFPDWDPYPNRKREALKPTPTKSENPSLVERYFKNRPTCGVVAGYTCFAWAAQNARNNLANLPAGTMCGGPTGCGRTTCADGAAIDLCNDRVAPLSIPCTRVHHASGEIIIQCQEYFDGEWILKGQWHDTDGYNVIVRRCY
ncbi:hypothetical protein TWF281_010394 [Arthrobotrys megalospora]